MSTHPTDPTDAELLSDFLLAVYAKHSVPGMQERLPEWFGGEACDMVREYCRALAELRQESGARKTPADPGVEQPWDLLDPDPEHAAIPPMPAAREGKVPAPYGYCPVCGAPGVSRERGINGNDRCPNGHKYPSKTAVPSAKDSKPDCLCPPFRCVEKTLDSCTVGFPSREAAEQQARHAASWRRLAEQNFGCRLQPDGEYIVTVVDRSRGQTFSLSGDFLRDCARIATGAAPIPKMGEGT